MGTEKLLVLVTHTMKGIAASMVLVTQVWLYYHICYV